jgi:hypothetical protein
MWSNRRILPSLGKQSDGVETMQCSATLENKLMVMDKQLYTLRKHREVALLRLGHLGGIFIGIGSWLLSRA